MSTLFLRVATVLLLVLAGCDAAPEPEPTAFTLTAQDPGEASTSVRAAPAADVEAVAVVEVALAPLRGEPADPALAGRYQATRVGRLRGRHPLLRAHRRRRPFGLRRGGRVVFEGDGASQTVAAPRLAASPSLTAGLGGARRRPPGRGGGQVLRPTEPERRVSVPAGEGAAEGYLLRAPAAD